MKRSDLEVRQFSEAFLDMKLNVVHCQSCGNVSDAEICAICSDEKRDQSTSSIVEDIRDVLAIEATQTYRGIYHVLGGIISPMDGVGPTDLNILPLIEKARDHKINEVIFALSPTMEGDTTNFYLYKKLKEFEIQITTLSRGVSVGSELQYADELTLGRSLINRQPFKTN